MPGNILTLPENRTYSIDLRGSWTNATVQINSIYKAAQVYNSAALWPDASGNSFYSYDGGYSQTIAVTNLTTNALWRFDPTNDSGSWAQVLPPALSNFSDLDRVQSGTYGYGNGLGFSLGGWEGYVTDRSLSVGDPEATSGLVIFNTWSNEWFNFSSTGYSSNGRASRGSAQFVPQFGKKGLLFILGGDANELGQYVPFDTITMWNMDSQQWAAQKATGTPPSPSANLCAVGVPGDNGSYEIFVYGGWQDAGDLTTRTEATLNNGAVYALTLPAFHWIKQSSALAAARYQHTCNVIGKRQMAVVGGVNVPRASAIDIWTPDPWPNGIDVFDLTEMNWVDQYDPDAADYQSPNMVKEFYETNSRYPAEWTSSEVESWFTESETSNNGTGAGESSASKGSNMDVGAIAGGTVGGVLCLLIAGLLFWWLLRRRRRSETRAADQRQSNSGPKHLADGTQRHEMDPKEKPHEFGGNPVYELPQTIHELSTQGRM